MGVKSHLFLSLGSHAKQTGDERHLPMISPFPIPCICPSPTMFNTSYSCNAFHVLSKEKKLTCSTSFIDVLLMLKSAVDLQIMTLGITKFGKGPTLLVPLVLYHA